MQLSTLLAHWMTSDKEQIGLQPLSGTVRTTIAGGNDELSYLRPSETLISGRSGDAARKRGAMESMQRPARQRAAKDLVTEINLIREQIQMMMCQVERAVSHLGASA